MGDNDVVGVNLYSFTEDYLIGGGGEDIIYISGDDFAVGGGANSVDNDLVELLREETFEAEFSFSDQQQDTFVFVNNGNGYKATVVGFEAGIDKLDLRQYNRPLAKVFYGYDC